MKTSLRRFALAAVAGLSVLALAQTPVHAQVYRVPPPRPVSVYRPAPRLPVVTPRVTSFTNPYVLPGMTLNQLGTLSVLSMDPTMLPLINSYYNMYRPISITSVYPTMPYAPYTTTTTIGAPTIAGNPYNFYNPYFAAFGLFP